MSSRGLADKDLAAATRRMPKDFSIRLLDGSTIHRDQAILNLSPPHSLA